MSVEAFHDDDGNIRLSLSLDLTKEQAPPTEFTIVPAGKMETSKGSVLFGRSSAESVMAAFGKHGQPDLPIDYDHGMLAILKTPDTSKAAGWFVPEIRDGALIATSVEWTPAAKEALKNREFRYLSPALAHDRKGNVKRLINVALTNLPATRNMKPLVANQTNPQPAKGKEKAMSETMLALLNASDEAEGIKRLNGVIMGYDAMRTALGAEDHDQALEVIKQLKSNGTTLAAKIRELEIASEERDRTALLSQLHDEGKLSEALMPWAQTQSLEVLQSFSEHATVDPKKADNPAPVQDNVIKLSDAQRDAAKVLNMSEAQYIELLKEEEAV